VGVIKKIFTLIAKIGSWFETSWEKIITKFSGKTTTTIKYTSRCWQCGTPIKAKKTYRFWEGHKQCPKEDCNYFLCNQCDKCWCESPWGKSQRAKGKTKNSIPKYWKET